MTCRGHAQGLVVASAALLWVLGSKLSAHASSRATPPQLRIFVNNSL